MKYYFAWLAFSVTALLVALPLINCSENSCFAAGTMIDTPLGPVAIERLSPGDRVFSFDHATGERRVGTVVRTFRHEEAEVRALQLSNGVVLRITDEHPIFDDASGSYVPAAEIAKGSPLMSFGGTAIQAVGWGDESEETVYNIEVAGFHNYFAEGILVHNKSDAAREDAGPSRDVRAPEPLGGLCMFNSECASGVCWEARAWDSRCGERRFCSESCVDDERCRRLARDRGDPNPNAAQCAEGTCNVLTIESLRVTCP